MALNDFIIDPKDAQRILIGASGKLGPMEFAQGLVAILAIWIVLQFVSLIPVIGWLISLVVGLALVFCWVCIFSKRFHDAGQSGWMAAAAVLAVIVISVVLQMILMPLFVGGALSAPSSFQAASPSATVLGIVVGLLANGAVGFYAYRLKPAVV